MCSKSIAFPQYRPQKKNIKAYLESLNTVEQNYHFFLCTYQGTARLGVEGEDKIPWKERKRRTGNQLSRVFAAAKGRELSAALL